MFFQETGVAGRTLPFTISEDPGIGEPADMVIRDALKDAFGMVRADHNGRSTVEVHFDILVTHDAGLEFGVPDVSKKLFAITDGTIPLGIYEVLADQKL